MAVDSTAATRLPVFPSFFISSLFFFILLLTQIRSDQPTRLTRRTSAGKRSGTGSRRPRRRRQAAPARGRRRRRAVDGDDTARHRRRALLARGRRQRRTAPARAVDADDERHPGICSASEEEAPETSRANVEESGDKCKQPHKEKNWIIGKKKF